MKVSLLAVGLFAFVGPSIYVQAQTHKATKAEVEFQNKVITTIFNSLPKNYKGWDRDLPIGDADDNKISEGDNISDCKGDECYESVEIIATFSGNRTQEAASIDKQISEAKDYAQKSPLEWKRNNDFGLTIRFMTNVTDDAIHYNYCANGGFTNPPAPEGWDNYTLVAPMACRGKTAGWDLPDYNIFSMGVAPTVENHYNKYKLNPAKKGTHTVQNIVLVLGCSKEVAQDFVKSMNTASLRSLLK